MKKLRGAAVALLAVGLLAGCSTTPGAAAVINGKTTVSEATVDNLAQEISSVGASRTNALNVALTVAVADPIMESKYSDKLTDKFKKESLESCTTQIGMTVTTKSDPTLQSYCHLVALATSDEDFANVVNDALSDASVELNPRYGDVSSDTGLPSYLTESDRSLPDTQDSSSSESSN
ncbi:MAG: hypothetical protein LKJ57_04775 [Ancrocorticia sp.]|jgi:mannitol-1-phosphate/altronate dehydrogenase|nr:hypothetical protein [Ancrocorticia sp.]MCI1896461.1 hypothetical protein [Ancrocorticia sp.]MCI1933079.1 hypothetical protein [Ancrocorticia sp.]MCI1963861.1 hypothetical protein [Ancrocorticia sp.]MCI2002199.1 hypothetical protein [Ancrocorticia sp.]